MHNETQKIWKQNDAGKWERKEVKGKVLQVGSRPSAEPPVGNISTEIPVPVVKASTTSADGKK